MQAPLPFSIQNENLWLSPERCIYWEKEKALVLADLHFGKTGHFRKSGIAVPQNIYQKDLQRLVEQVQYFQPQKLIVVGDLFHSHNNKELDLFKKWRHDLRGIEIWLVKGNHDILLDEWYEAADIRLYNHQVIIESLAFIHDITQAETLPGHYYFSAHIHPGVRISGAGKQTLSFPCFYFGKNFAVLPAFGAFTGYVAIEPAPGEKVFAIVQNKIIPF